MASSRIRARQRSSELQYGAASVHGCPQIAERFPRALAPDDATVAQVHRAGNSGLGGAIALGHPVGLTGARSTWTLLSCLVRRDKTVGLATIFVGGGLGMAMIIERLG